MQLDDLEYACRMYSEIGRTYDESYGRFRLATDSRPDLTRSEHRRALLRWLNKWGCRQFAIRYHDLASRNLAAWMALHEERLPSRGASIMSLTESDLRTAGDLELSLENLQASVRHRQDGPGPVHFRATGASKILFALRRHAFAPCDKSIRTALGLAGRHDWYADYLLVVRQHLDELVSEASIDGIEPHELPAQLGRPLSSLPKLVDEYHWITITKGIKVPEGADPGEWRP